MAGGQNNFTFTTSSLSGSTATLANYNASIACFPQFPKILSTSPTCPGTKPAVQFFADNFQMPQVHQFDLIVEQDLGWRTSLSVSYLGALGRSLPNFGDVNICTTGNSNCTATQQPSSITYQVCTSIASGVCNSPGFLGLPSTYTTPLFRSRANSSFGAMTAIFSGTTSNYNALAIQLNHRMSRHIQFGTNFTWSHALDFGQNNSTFTDTNDLLLPFNVAAEYGNSNQNVPKRFVFHAVAESPWHYDGWLGQLTNDWQLAPIYQWQNGLPYTLRTSGSAPGGVAGAINGSGGSFDAARILEVGRNTFRRPNTSVVDLRLSKRLTYRERFGVELSAEAFNLFNHVNITGVNQTGAFVGSNVINALGTAAVPTLTLNGPFGSNTNANSNFAYSPRQIQLGIRVRF
jgi:hypothetical protein